MTGWRIGSLFSGVGGLELGLERAGMGEVVWQVEREPYAQQVLAKHWPHAKRYDDVTTVGAHNLSPVDVICGGFPCQDISTAGRGAGLKGARSGLWFQMLRIIEEVKPYVVIAENVAALRARGLPIVVAGLRDAGYRVVVVPCSAADVGAPHKRERIFICAVRAVGLADRYGSGRGPIAPRDVSQANVEVARRHDADGRDHFVGVGQANADSAQREGQRECAVADAGRRSELNRVASDGHFGVGLADAKRDGRQGSRAHGHAIGRAASSEGQASYALDGGAAREGVGWAEPDMGRAADGLSGWLDGIGRFAAEVAKEVRWPARPGQPQHAWEAPRVAKGVRDRSHRLKALGNAVAPPVAEAVGRWVLRWCEYEMNRGES